MKVQKQFLLLVAGLVWGFAGFNILRIGIQAYAHYWSIWNLLLSTAVFVVFQCMVFQKLVRKHTQRITGYEEDQQFILKFFDVKSFCIMAFMMTFGIALRHTGWCPEVFIAVFYTGLGCSLCLAGILFLMQFCKLQFERPHESPRDDALSHAPQKP